jgi:MoaA/NifB/PqqE/SkfB family radical SAM enzyme
VVPVALNLTMSDLPILSKLLVWVEVTQRCQLKCRYCYNPWRSEPSSTHSGMTDGATKSLVAFCEDLAASYELEFAIAGGDPTAHEKYIEIASQLSGFGPTAIVTHGCSFTENDLERISEAGTLRLQFSIPSLDEEQFKFVTGGGSLRKLLSNLAKASALGIPLSMSAVVSQSKTAKHDIIALIRLAKEAKAERLIFNKFLPSGRGELYDEAFSLSEDEFRMLLQSAKKQAGPNEVSIFVSEEHAGVRRLKIEQPKITVTHDGRIRTCSMASSDIGDTSSKAVDVMERYEQFWASGSSDDNCICSMSSATSQSKTATI